MAFHYPLVNKFDSAGSATVLESLSRRALSETANDIRAAENLLLNRLRLKQAISSEDVATA